MHNKPNSLQPNSLINKEKKRVINYNKRKIREVNSMLIMGTITQKQANSMKRKFLKNIHNEIQLNLF